MADDAQTFHDYCLAEIRRYHVPPTLIIEAPECNVERAAHAVYQAVADFTLAIQEAETIAEARRIWNILDPLVSVMESTQRAALKRTETLNP